MHGPDAAAAEGAAALVAVEPQLVVLRLGREEYALPIDQVQEIIFWSTPRTVSSTTPWVSGVIALRGRILPVHDLAMRLGVPGGTDQTARIVILETMGGPIGVTVDDATEVLTVSPDDLEPLPDGTAHDLLTAICKVQDRLIAVLDLTTLHAGPTTPAGEALAAAPKSAASVATPGDAGGHEGTPTLREAAVAATAGG